MSLGRDSYRKTRHGGLHMGNTRRRERVVDVAAARIYGLAVGLPRKRHGNPKRREYESQDRDGAETHIEAVHGCHRAWCLIKPVPAGSENEAVTHTGVHTKARIVSPSPCPIGPRRRRHSCSMWQWDDVHPIWPTRSGFPSPLTAPTLRVSALASEGRSPGWTCRPKITRRVAPQPIISGRCWCVLRKTGQEASGLHLHL